MPTLDTRLAPGLLLAMPHLQDPNFTRAVVLMIEHNDEGSFGLIVNQPSTMDAATLLGAMDIEWNGDGGAVVWSGGPVMPTSGWVLHGPSRAVAAAVRSLAEGSTIEVVPGVALSTSPDNLRAIASDPPDQVRLLLGYSGWGPGQLASEMARGAWLVADASPDLVFDTPAEDMWASAVRSLGIDPEAIVQSRGIH
ncbi:MAG TPA: YqgE/AlgH family protein [Kofleriaceae bacterium]|nr:YqgE/AlgH family protein [Kofleriaceae bacterium]